METPKRPTSLRDLNQLVHFYPALKRWAKLVRPSGAEFSTFGFVNEYGPIAIRPCFSSKHCREFGIWLVAVVK